MQTIELKTILQEKEDLQTELHNTKAIAGTIKYEKAALEDQIKNLNEKFDNMTIVDSSIYLASKLGSLSVKEIELKNTQDELEETKKTLVDKVRVLTETTTENENLRKQEIKKLKDYLLILQDEIALVDTCLSNVNLVQGMMGDKPVQAQRAINFLNSQSKMQLQFYGIQDIAELIVQTKKYIVKETLAKEVLVKANFLKARVDQFKNAFKFLFDNGFPSFWNEEGIIIIEDDYLSLWNQKKNDTSLIDELDPIIKGNHIYDM